MNPWRKLTQYEFLVPEEVLINLTRVVDTNDDLTEDELRYLNTRVKPKEVIIIIFMLLLWLFSIHRYCTGHFRQAQPKAKPQLG